MKQVIQSFKSGELSVSDVPSPSLRTRGILVRSSASLVSAGTERMIVDFAEKSLIQKARARPDLVKQVLEKAQREGMLNTLDSVRNRLDQPLPLGYSSAGVVVAVGAAADAFQVGDRVACAGSGFASHAELVSVPRNLAVKLPAAVSCEAGAFVTLGAIALQGIRQAETELGHKVCVIGLGLLGQLTVQMLRASGCQVFGVDLSPSRVALALELGAEHACINDDAEVSGDVFTGGRGFDAVLITADTKSNGPVELAGALARPRAIVVAVGAVGMTIPRKVYYEKELDFRLSRSYGPGRYDSSYEEQGQDYPYPYVRWTEQRNMEAVAQLIASGSVRVDRLTTHRFAIDDALQAYDLITGKTGDSFLGVLLTYGADHELPSRISLLKPAHPSSQRTSVSASEVHQASKVRLGLLGAGLFVNATLLPAMKKVVGVEPIGVVSGSGLTARSVGDRYGFAYCASEESALLEDARINWLAIVTRHNLHSRQAIAGMRAGKDVFVEKPLALNRDELTEVLRVREETGRRLMVGFNRRFAPMVQEMRRFLSGRQRPMIVICRVNAGAIPRSHWTHDPAEGGGRIIGEACHFLDLLQFVLGSPPVEVHTHALQTAIGPVDDEVVLTLTFADGSVGTIVYAAGGDKSFSKERVEVIGDGKVAVLDDYRILDLITRGKRTRRKERLRPSKGHRGQWQALADATASGGPSPIDPGEIATAHLAAYAALESLRLGHPVALETGAFWEALRREAGGQDEGPSALFSPES